MRRIIPVAVAVLLAVVAAASARVVQPSTEATERGGQALPRSGNEADCGVAAGVLCAVALPFGPFGWFGPPDGETLARLDAGGRAAIAAERAAWRRIRPVGRPRLAGRGLLLLHRPQPRLR